MKNIFFALTAIFFVACKTSDITPVESEPIIKDGNIVSTIVRKNLEQPPYSDWFTPRYQEYQPKQEAMNTLIPMLKDKSLTIKCFMGTWCGDSKREVPRLFKILDQAGFSYNKLEIIGLDRSKVSPKNEQLNMNITNVPTIIFYKKGVEIGRFIESPQAPTTEEDFINILNKK